MLLTILRAIFILLIAAVAMNFAEGFSSGFEPAPALLIISLEEIVSSPVAEQTPMLTVARAVTVGLLPGPASGWRFRPSGFCLPLIIYS